MEDFIREWWTRNEGQVLAWRRHLHAHPELSHMEHGTTQFVADKLRAAGWEIVEERQSEGWFSYLCK